MAPGKLRLVLGKGARREPLQKACPGVRGRLRGPRMTARALKIQKLFGSSSQQGFQGMQGL